MAAPARKVIPLQILLPLLDRQSANLAVLEILSHVEVATTRQIAKFRFNTPTQSQLQRTALVVKNLRDKGLVLTRPTKDEITQYKINAVAIEPVHGLTDFGVQVAKEKGLGDPKPFEPERSLLNFGHDLKITDLHYTLEQLCIKEGWLFGFRQTDTYRIVEPDKLFYVWKPSQISLFLEQQNRKREFADLYFKHRRYHDLYDTDECEKLWGFRKFYVLMPFLNEERMMNYVKFLASECHCPPCRGKVRHTCLPHGLHEKPLTVPHFWFTYDDLTQDISGKIWITPKNYTSARYSFHDLS